MLSWKRELRPGDQDVTEEQQRQTRPPKHHTTSKSGCKACRKMPLKRGWQMVMWVIMGLSGEMLILSMWVEVEDVIEDKAPQDCWYMLLVDLLLQGEGVPIEEVIRVTISWLWWEGLGSRESNWARRAGRGMRIKVNLLIFKDEKTKDTVTYHSWRWDIAIFHCSGWDNQHLLPYIFWSLKGFPGDLARSLGKDATLTSVLQTLDKHYGMVMTFNALSKELTSFRQGSGENMVEFGVHLSQQVWIFQSEYPGRIQQEQVEEMEWDHFYKGLNPKYWHMLAHKVDAKHPLATQSWSLPRSWKDGQKPEILCSQRPPQLEDWMLTGHRHLGICFPLGGWMATIPSLLNPL